MTSKLIFRPEDFRPPGREHDLLIPTRIASDLAQAHFNRWLKEQKVIYDHGNGMMSFQNPEQIDYKPAFN